MTSDRLESLVERIEDDIVQQKILDSGLQATEKEQLVRARLHRRLAASADCGKPWCIRPPLFTLC
jgi:hypothetical protein